MNQRAKQLQVHIEDLLLLMNASKIGSHPSLKASRTQHVPLRAFDKAEPILLAEVTHSEFMDETMFTDVALGDLPSPLDFGLMRNGTSGIVAVDRMSVVRRPYFPVKRLTRHIVAHRMLLLRREGGTGETVLTYYGSNTGLPGDWVHLVTGAQLAEDSEGAQHALTIALGLQFTRDYTWRAYLKWPDTEVGVTVPTTPEGARALFRLRDYEEGASRRKALIHWVSEHSRRIRKDTEEETRVWVREHKRGVAKFKWQDMEGAIYPAAADLRRLQQAKGAKR